MGNYDPFYDQILNMLAVLGYFVVLYMLCDVINKYVLLW